MRRSYTEATLGGTGINVRRLGLSASYWPGRKTIYRALDEGLNFFFLYGFDVQMVKVLRDVFRSRREQLVVATGPYNLIWGGTDPRKTLEKRLRQLGTDYIDVFLFLGVMKPEQFPDRVKEEFCRFLEEGKVRAIGVSTHDRKFAGRLAKEGLLNALMIRYNAAHRGAEQDIFPHLETHQPALISYTATRWRYLLRRPRQWPKDHRVPTAEMCYRFVLTNPHVDVCLTAPTNIKQLNENIKSLQNGPLTEDDLSFMQRFGDAVHHTKKWFM